MMMASVRYIDSGQVLSAAIMAEFSAMLLSSIHSKGGAEYASMDADIINWYSTAALFWLEVQSGLEGMNNNFTVASQRGIWFAARAGDFGMVDKFFKPLDSRSMIEDSLNVVQNYLRMLWTMVSARERDINTWRVASSKMLRVQSRSLSKGVNAGQDVKNDLHILCRAAERFAGGRPIPAQAAMRLYGFSKSAHKKRH